MIKTLSVTLLTEKNYPTRVVRVTEEQGHLNLLTDALLAKARVHNPELSMDSLVRAVIRVGVKKIADGIEKERLDPFLRNRRG